MGWLIVILVTEGINNVTLIMPNQNLKKSKKFHVYDEFLKKCIDHSMVRC